MLDEIVKNSSDESGAEATYLLALIDNKQGEYNDSIDKCIALIGEFGSYQKWTDETYLLLVKNYIDLDEILQAKATLESIIENSANEALKERANSILLDVLVKESEVLIPELDTAGQ